MDTKKLRQKILDLAIHGKLVPQDPNDEPASVLLERIKAEKERLIKEGKIKRSKKSAKTSDTPHYQQNVPFEVPGNWVWTTVSDISKSILYGVSESAKTKGKYKLLRITDIQNNRVDWDSVPFTDFDEDKVSPYLLNDGDIVFARTGATVGKSYLINGLNHKAIYASYLIRVQTFDFILPQYVKLFFESGYYWEQIELGSVGIGQPNVNGTILGNLNIPLPPLVEQQRIVEEIKKWFALIDQIEHDKADLQTIIRQTKGKILDLAIRGKLVPQDPSDESASELLKRINPKAEITCDNGHSKKLPQGWIYCRLCDVLKITMGQSPIGDSISKDRGLTDFPLILSAWIDPYNQMSPILNKQTIKDFSIRKSSDKIEVYNTVYCIVFDKSILLSSLQGGMSSDNVLYVENFDGDIHVKDSSNISSFFQSHVKEIFFTKTKDWSYENEYRILLKTNSKKEKFLSCQNSIMAVILNYAEDVNYLDSVFNSFNARLFECVFPKVLILELGSWFGKPNLRDKDGNDWE